MDSALRPPYFRSRSDNTAGRTHAARFRAGATRRKSRPELSFSELFGIVLFALFGIQAGRRAVPARAAKSREVVTRADAKQLVAVANAVTRSTPGPRIRSSSSRTHSCTTNNTHLPCATGSTSTAPAPCSFSTKRTTLPRRHRPSTRSILSAPAACANSHRFSNTASSSRPLLTAARSTPKLAPYYGLTAVFRIREPRLPAGYAWARFDLTADLVDDLLIDVDPATEQACADIGTRALVIVPTEINILMHPGHEGFEFVGVSTPVGFSFDPRLLKLGSLPL